MTMNTFTKAALILLGLLALTGVQAKEKITFYHHDALGNIVAATDEQGEILWKEHYDPYGNRLTRDQAAADNRIWYTGHQENDFGLIYMGARHYDPTTGRFLSVDPLDFREKNIQSFNRYAYANNNPYRYWDPDGREDKDYFKGIANAAADSTEMLFCGACALSSQLGGPSTPRFEYKDETDGQIGEFLASSIGPGGTFKGGMKFGFSKFLVGNGAKNLCFAEGTLVHTLNGLKPIETLLPGDLVRSKDEATGDIDWKPIIEVFHNKNRPVLSLRLADENNIEETLKVTEEHPFWVKGKGWTTASELQGGDRLGSADGRELHILESNLDSTAPLTYNIEVENFHTYFVGKGGAWVHNRCRGLWQVTKEGTDRVIRHDKFGKIYKSKSDGLWWSKDTAGHGGAHSEQGGSAWKVFRETKKGLEWVSDADKYGDFIDAKHKGDIGKFIPWKELTGAKF